jgi:hypothetical protein
MRLHQFVTKVAKAFLKQARPEPSGRVCFFQPFPAVLAFASAAWEFQSPFVSRQSDATAEAPSLSAKALATADLSRRSFRTKADVRSVPFRGNALFHLSALIFLKCGRKTAPKPQNHCRNNS